MEAMEKLRAKSSQESNFLSSDPSSMPIYLEVSPHTGPHQGGIYPQLPAISPGPCPQHRRPLELYCYDDMKCVCDECCRHEHDGHRVVKPEKERWEKQVWNHTLLVFTLLCLSGTKVFINLIKYLSTVSDLENVYLCPYVQRALIQKQAEIQQKILENERKLKELPQVARLHNVRKTLLMLSVSW